LRKKFVSLACNSTEVNSQDSTFKKTQIMASGSITSWQIKGKKKWK